jgi:hypothetical protein
VVELPKLSAGYGAPVKLPFSSLFYPRGIAVDNADNVFISDAEGEENSVLELPMLKTGYGAQTTVFGPIKYLRGLAVDSVGNLYISSIYNDQIFEIVRQTPADFGHVYACAPGQSKPAPCSQTLTLSYTINSNVTLGMPQVVSLNAPDLDFTLASSGTCSGFPGYGLTCSLTVTFAPQGVGTRNGAVEIVDTKGNLLASTPITGLGLYTADVPQVQVTPSLLQFGTLPYGSSESLPVTITNIGGGTLNVTSLSINAKSFTFSGDTCTTGVASGQSCTLQVKFNPINIAAFDNTLTIGTNASSSTSTVTLEAIASGITVTGAPLEFGSVPYGAKSVLLLTVGNHWLPGAITIGAATSGPSVTVLNNPQNTCMAGIVSGGTCTLPVQFAPDGVGAHNGILTLTPTGGGAPLSVSLYGSGSGLVAGSQYLQFGTIPLGSTAVLPLTVTNFGLPGTVMVGVTASGPSYTVLNTAQNTCQAGVASGKTCTLLIQFSPVGVGGHNGILTLTPNTGGAEGITIALDGGASAP